MTSSATRTTVAIGNRVARDPVADDDEPEQHAGDRRDEPHHVEEHERVEVALHVLLPQPPEEAPQQQPRDPRHDVAVAHVRALADAVDRPRREVAHARVPDVEVDEHVVREAVVRVDVVEVELLEHLPRDRRVAGLRVGDVPVARGDLRQHREDRVPEEARLRDQLPRLAGGEAVRLRVVELAARDRLDERRQVLRIHLVVAVHHDDDVEPVGHRPAVAGDGRRADAAPALVREHLHPRVAELERALARAVGGAVVDDEDPVDERRDARRASRRSAPPRRTRARRPPRACPRTPGEANVLAVARRDARGDGLPQERGERAEDQPDQRADHDRVAAAARRDLVRGGVGEDVRRLDLGRQQEQLRVGRSCRAGSCAASSGGAACPCRRGSPWRWPC